MCCTYAAAFLAFKKACRTTAGDFLELPKDRRNPATNFREFPATHYTAAAAFLNRTNVFKQEFLYLKYDGTRKSIETIKIEAGSTAAPYSDGGA